MHFGIRWAMDHVAQPPNWAAFGGVYKLRQPCCAEMAYKCSPLRARIPFPTCEDEHRQCFLDKDQEHTSEKLVIFDFQFDNMAHKQETGLLTLGANRWPHQHCAQSQVATCQP